MQGITLLKKRDEGGVLSRGYGLHRVVEEKEDG
jgi:hypothetical protein